MQAPEDAIEAVSQRLESFLSDRLTEVADVGPLASDFGEIARSSLGGGKRLRAAFCISGWRAVGDADAGPAPLSAAVVAAAASLEVFQTAALVHDDIIDNSDTRRGRPSAHRRLETAHRDAGWAGDAEAHGRSAAILLGDLLVAWSDDLFEAGLMDAAPEHAASARREYAQMRRDVTLGQYLDIAAEGAFAHAEPDEQLDRALQVASYKSARYSVQQPILIGAALAGAQPAQRRALADFGHGVGLAFQLRDDVLGVFGDAAVTGKPAGDDLREGKRTALIALTRAALQGSDRTGFDRLVGDPTADEETIARAQTTIRSSGALERVEALIAEHAQEADAALTGAPLDAAAVTALRDLARRAIERSA